MKYRYRRTVAALLSFVLSLNSTFLLMGQTASSYAATGGTKNGPSETIGAKATSSSARKDTGVKATRSDAIIKYDEDGFLMDGELANDLPEDEVEDIPESSPKIMAAGKKAVGMLGATLESIVATVGNDEFDNIADAVAAASAGGTVTLEADITEQVVIPSDASVTLDLNGQNISFDDQEGYEAAIYVSQGAGLTVTGTGNVSGSEGSLMVMEGAEVTVNDGIYTGGVRNLGGELTIINGAYIGSVDNLNNGTLVIKGGEFDYVMQTGENNANGAVTVYGGLFFGILGLDSPTGGTVTVNGGTFEQASVAAFQEAEAGVIILNGGKFYQNIEQKSAGCDIEIHGGNFTRMRDFVFDVPDGSTAKISIDGGIYGEDITGTGYLAQGVVCEALGDGTFKVTSGSHNEGPAASIDSEMYDTIAEAVSAALSGSTIKLEADITEQVVIPSDASIILDLNSHGIFFDGSAEGDAGIYVSQGAGVTVTGEGSVTGEKGSVCIMEGAEVTLENGTYTNSVMNYGGELTITDGIYESPVNNLDNGTTVIEGGVFNDNVRQVGEDNANGSITINGGTINGNLRFKSPTGGTVTVNNGTFTGAVIAEDGVAAGVIILNGGTYRGLIKDYFIQQYSNGCNIEIHGGDYAKLNGILFDYYVPEGSTATISIDGGTFGEDITGTGFLAQGCICEEQGNGTWVVKEKPVIRVAGVTLDKTDVSLAVGKTQKLTATVEPEDAANKAVTWISSDQSIATVASDGTVTAVSAGTATITVTTEDGSKTATCKVTVTVPVTGVTLNKTTLSLAVGASQKLTATVAPTNATNKAVTWSTSNQAIATVTADGTVKGVKAGTATITVKTKDGGKTAACKVTVTVPVTGVTLSKTTLSLAVGASQKLTATVSPTNAANKAVTWSTSNQAIATVTADGTIKAVKAGTATITVKTKDGGKTAACKVTVTVPVTGVKLSKTTLSLAVGKSQKLTATVSPTNATNKAVTFSTSNKAIATVAADGTVKGVKAGTATITVKTKDGGKTAFCKVTVTVPVTGVKLSRTTLSLAVGKSQKLTATVSPTNATNKAVTWSTSNKTIATVAADGTIKGVKAGTATITVKTKDGSKTASCKVTVTVPVTGVKLGKTSLELAVGKTQKLTATVSPTNATNKAVTWSTSNKAIATVAADGTIKGVKTGQVTITATTKDGSKKASCKVLVVPLNGWLTLNGKDYWYENGVRQGLTGRGKEIYDPGTKAWYWLDAVYDGAKAVNKEVYQDSSGGKWVRYDAEGHMIKGWYTTNGKTYYYNLKTGAMTKGTVTIDGKQYTFDSRTGVLQ